MQILVTEREWTAVNQLIDGTVDSWAEINSALGLKRRDLIEAVLDYVSSPGFPANGQSLLGLVRQLGLAPMDVMDVVFELDALRQGDFLVRQLRELSPSLVDAARIEGHADTSTRRFNPGGSDSRRRIKRDFHGRLSQLRPGDVVAEEYIIGTQIGFGGYGWVYSATALSNDSEVAVKLTLRRDEVSEASIHASLQHPSIVPLIDSGFEDDHEYLVMKKCDSTLNQTLKSDSPLDLDQAIGIVLDISSAVEHMHSRNILHLDIKPRNILVDDGQRVYLSDFGLSLPVSVAKEARLVCGTLGYASPEQISRKGADQRSDVFALGVLLYELTTRQSPFEIPKERTDAPEYLERMIATQVVPPSTRSRTASTGVDEICIRALQRDPDLRYQSVHDFRQAAMRLVNPEIIERPLTRMRIHTAVWSEIDNPANLMSGSMDLLTASRETMDKRAEATALVNLGVAYSRLGSLSESIYTLSQAVVVAADVGDGEIYADALWALSQSYSSAGNQEQALRSASAARQVYESLGSIHLGIVVKWLEASE